MLQLIIINLKVKSIKVIKEKIIEIYKFQFFYLIYKNDKLYYKYYYYFVYLINMILNF